jgi:hypothetical protein
MALRNGAMPKFTEPDCSPQHAPPTVPVLKWGIPAGGTRNPGDAPHWAECPRVPLRFPRISASRGSFGATASRGVRESG